MRRAAAAACALAACALAASLVSPLPAAAAVSPRHAAPAVPDARFLQLDEVPPAAAATKPVDDEGNPADRDVTGDAAAPKGMPNPAPRPSPSPPGTLPRHS